MPAEEREKERRREYLADSIAKIQNKSSIVIDYRRGERRRDESC